MENSTQGHSNYTAHGIHPNITIKVDDEEVFSDEIQFNEIMNDINNFMEEKKSDTPKQGIITIKQGIKELFTTTAPYTLSRAFIASYNLLNGILFPFIDPSAVAAGPLISTF